MFVRLILQFSFVPRLKKLSVFVFLVMNLVCYSKLANANDEIINLTLSSFELLKELGEANHEAMLCEHIVPYMESKYRIKNYLEIIILCDSFKKSSLSVRVKVISAPGYKRSIKHLENGLSDMSAELVWLEDINKNDFYYSEPVFGVGEYEKGIYTLPNNHMQKAKFENLDLSQYAGVTVINWARDLAILSTLTPHITKSLNYQKLFEMLENKRADFTLMNFGNRYVSAKKLKLVKGVKVKFMSSRHLIIAKKHPNAKLLIEAINNHIVELREQDKLFDLYYNWSHFEEEIKHWKVLNNK